MYQLPMLGACEFVHFEDVLQFDRSKWGEIVSLIAQIIRGTAKFDPHMIGSSACFYLAESNV